MRLIYLGSPLTVGGVVMALISASPVVRTAMHQPASFSGATVAGTVFAGPVAACIWLWMARQIKRGWSKARVTAVSLFAINTIAIDSSNAEGISDHWSFIFELAEWGVGLLAIVSLWDPRCSAYFAELKYARSLAVPEWPKKAMPQAGGPRHSKR